MRPSVLVALAAGLLLPALAQAQLAIAVSPDTTVNLGGETVADEEVFAGGVLPLGTLPGRADVDAYQLLPNGDQLYSFDTTTDLGGGLVVRPSDVVRFDGTTDSIEFDGLAAGLPDGANVDAVALHSSGALLLSFDTTIALNGITAHDEDLVRFQAPNIFVLEFDGSAQSVATGLDLDGAATSDNSTSLFLSFDGSGALGAVNFDDEDVLEFDAGQTWTLFYDGSSEHAGLAASDINAVPEPAVGLQLLAGSGALAGLALRRRRTPTWS